MTSSHQEKEMKITMILLLVMVATAFTEANVLKYRRGISDLQHSYIVHYNSQGETLSVARFDDFVRALNDQKSGFGMGISSYSENSKFSSPIIQMASSGLTTTTTQATTISHQPKPLATETSTTSAPASASAATKAPESLYVTVSSTESPLKLPHELPGTSPVAEISASTEKPSQLILALGHDVATTSVVNSGNPFSTSDLTNLITSGEYSPSKTFISGLGFPHGTDSTSKLISLQPRVQAVLNYGQQSPVATQSYFPTGGTTRTSYVQTVPTNFQKPYGYPLQTETINYASYPSQNLPIENNSPLIVRQTSSLIDIGQGLGEGYSTPPRELSVNFGGWRGSNYNNRRSIHQIGFGIGSW